METHADVFDAFRGGTKLTRALNAVGCTVDRGTVYAWKMRRRIPSRYWVHVAAAAAWRGLDGITVARLAELDAASAQDKASAPSQAGPDGAAVSGITDPAGKQAAA